MTEFRAFIQARMSSRRFPGKVLASLWGKPVIDHVLETAGRVLAKEHVVLLTSTDPSDDILAGHATNKGWTVFRGDLNNVFKRFRDAQAAYPCRWFLRICADSPLLDPELLGEAIRTAGRFPHMDIVTNVFPRTFPKGQSFEALKTDTFLGIDLDRLTAQEREHITDAYYHYPQQYRIMNLRGSPARERENSFALDTPDDLVRLEALAERPDFASGLLREERKDRT